MTASAVDLQAVGTQVSGSGTSLTSAYPVGWAQDDFAFLAVYQGFHSAITTPTGWTASTTIDFGSNRRLAIFTRKLQSGDTPSITVSWAGSVAAWARITTYRGVHTSTPLDGSAAASGLVAASTLWQINPLPVPTVAGSRTVIFTAASDTGGFIVRGPNQADGDAIDGRIEEPYGTTATTPALGLFDVAQTNLGAHSLATDLTLASTKAEQGAYIVLTMKPADGTLQPQVENQGLGTYSPGAFRPLLLQPALRSLGYPLSTADGNPRFVVQVCDTTDSSRHRWIDVSDRFRQGGPQRGQEQPADRPRVGSASVTLSNLDGLISPWATSGAFTTSSVSFMRAGSLMRFGVTLAGHSTLPDGWYPWFVGRIEDVEEGVTDFRDAWVTYQVTELTAEAAADNRVAVGAVGAGDVPYTRVFRVLDGEWLYGVDLTRYSDTAIGDSISLQATTLNGNALNELYLVADSIYRRVLGGTDGALWVTRMYPAAGTGVAYSFTNDIGVYPSSMPLVNVTPYASRDRILNRVRAMNVGGTNDTEGDATSVRKFGVRAQGYGFPRSDLIQTNHSDLITVLTAWGVRHAYDELGIGSIEVDADQNPALWGVLTDIFSQGLEQHYVIEVQWVHPSLNIFDFVAVVNGFSFSVTANGPGVAASLAGTLSLEVFTAPTS